MTDDELGRAIEDLGSNEPQRMASGVRWLEPRLASLDDQPFAAAVEALCGLFFIDTFDRPDLEPLLEQAQGALAQGGPRVIPRLLDAIRGSDIKSHLCLGQALGRIGSPAIPALRAFIATEEDAYCRTFGLFALGKIADPAVHEALPEIVGCLMHPDREVRDSAARTLGKVAEVVPASALSPRRRTEMFEALFRCLRDPQPVVRAKTIRTLGKMAASGYLEPAQRGQALEAARGMLGQGERYEWDNAYIVRREAAHAVRMLAE